MNAKSIFKRSLLLFVALVSLSSVSMFAQNVQHIKGKVLDSQGEAVIGASVKLKDVASGTVTDVNGNYSLEVEKGKTLVFSYMGMLPQEVVIGTQTNLDIVLEEDSKQIDEVVVVGYSSVRKADVTTAVSTVSTKDVDSRPLVSAAQAMQGQAAGVQVIQPSGAPGGDMVVRIRGNTSITASNDPLYVIDGVPMDNINGLSPNDIESMSILKDASSAAIYGSRGANGVVLITTKRGRSGESKITFNSYYGFSNVARSMHSLNTAQYRDLMNEIGLVNIPDNLTDQTDWFKETYKTGINQNYQLSISNGTDKFKYFLSGGYTGDKGIINTSYYKRYNFRLNIENQVRSWLKVSANVSYSDYTGNGGDVITGTGSNRGGVVLAVINTPTYAPIMDPEHPDRFNENFYGANIKSPVESMNRTAANKSKNNRFIGSGSAEIKFNPEFKFKSTVSINRVYTNSTTWLDPFNSTDGRNSGGGASDNRILNTIMTYDNIFTYDKSFNKHNLSLLGGTSGTTSLWERSYVSSTYFGSSDIQTVNGGNRVDPYGTGSWASDWTIMSYLGRASYNYDSRYLFTVNMRADGSSKLSPSARWGYFPSMSLGWRMSSENFMKDISWIDDLKLRAGWGQTGNQSGLGDYAYLQQWNANRQNWWEEGKGQSTITYSPASVRTPDLTWETTTQTNIGVDWTLLKSRLTVTLDAYYKYTNNLLMTVNLPAPYLPITRNEGEMSNRGFEFAVNSHNIKGALNWDSQFNISINRNKLEKLTLSQVYVDGTTSEATSEQVVRLVPGESIGKFWGYKTLGVNSETGDMIFLDKNGNPQSPADIKPSDKTYIGDPNPKFTFGLTNNLTYNNFVLNIFLTGSYGNDIYNASRIETEGMYNGNNQSTSVLNRWETPGQITNIPRAVNGTDNLKASSRWIEDGSYVRLKTLTLSYNVKNRLLSKWNISKVQPYITAQNLLTITNYSGFDPEVNQWGNNSMVQGIDWGTYPQTKTFILGLNVEF